MRIIDLNGNIQTWKLSSASQSRGDYSDLHIKARSIIKDIYNTVIVLEEVPICIKPREILYLDFYVPLYQIAIEIQGQQHFEYIYHFHRTRMNFLKHMRRDRDKKEWCDVNKIELIELLYSENAEQWRRKLDPS